MSRAGLAAYGPMQGRVVLVTGASRGIGYAAAHALAAAGAQVIVLSRNRERTNRAAARISAETGGAAVPLVADFTELDQVRRAAAEVLERFGTLDVLANNAGAIYPRREATGDGFEKTLQVDHLAPFLLAALLAPALVAAAPSRVINVSSDAHLAAYRGFDFDDPGLERGWTPFRAYAQAKLANIMFSAELARQWAPLTVTSNAMHPGLVRTGFGRTDWEHTAIWKRLDAFYLTPEQGADTLVYLASSQEVYGASGLYYFKRRPRRPNAAARDVAAQRRLWDWSVVALGLQDDPALHIVPETARA